MMRYAFHVDASACSGCKACEMACRDRNALPSGVHWRRVYEVAGGGWSRRGDAWVNDVVAYNVSVACNHCDRAICTEVCPTGAMAARDDGFVLIDAAHCIGCRYCEWACPYAAPQYDPAAGIMTKCTGCSDDVARGRQPACVAACPLRALDFGEATALTAHHGETASFYPLPAASLTLPSLLLTAHAAGITDAADNGARRRVGGDDAATRSKPRLSVRNLEEVAAASAMQPMREPSLVAFTLLAQMAASLFCSLLAVRVLAGPQADALLATPFLAVGPLMLAAMLASLLHLGKPLRAWRAVANVRTSWLSREIASSLAFVLGWAAYIGMSAAGWASPGGRLAVGGVAALAAVGQVYSMARIYRLRTVPAWDSPFTTATFLLTALSLGTLAAALLLSAAAAATGQYTPLLRSAVIALLIAAVAGLVADLLLELYRRGARSPESGGGGGRMRAALRQAAGWPALFRIAGIVLPVALVAGTLASGASSGSTVLPPAWLPAGAALALAVAAASAVSARSAFYARHSRGAL
jgi:anaerobic dimethyl sulfoxide reductase subunit B